MKIFISISKRVDNKNVNEFLTSLLLLARHVYTQNDCRQLFNTLEQGRSTVSRKLGISSRLSRYFDKFQKTGKLGQEDLVAVGEVLKSVKERFSTDNTIDKDYITYFNNISVFLRKNSVSSWTQLCAKVGIVECPELSRLLVPTVRTTSGIHNGDTVAIKGSPDWHTAVITSLDTNQFTVRYLDGSTFSYPASELQEPSLVRKVNPLLAIHDVYAEKDLAKLTRTVVNNSAESLYASMLDLAQKMGYSTAWLDQRQLSTCRENPKFASFYTSYFDSRRQLNTIIKNEVQSFVRASGKKLVTIISLLQYLTRNKIPNNLPIGFLGGKIDELGKMYTSDDKLLNGIPYGEVVMNPKHDPDTDTTYIVSTVDNGSGLVVNYSTVDKVKSYKDSIHAKVSDFIQDEKAYRAKWIEPLMTNSSVLTRSPIIAAMLEISYQVGCRIGGKDNETDGVPTYGLTTLMVHNVQIDSDTLSIRYLGKKKHEQSHHFKAVGTSGRKVLSIVKQLIRGKKPNDLVFVDERGKPITDNIVRSFMKDIGLSISPHNFRHIAGTKMAIPILKGCPYTAKTATQTKVDAWVRDNLKPIGEFLHHASGSGVVTGMTAVRSYIDPQVMIDFYTKLGLHVPSWVP